MPEVSQQALIARPQPVLAMGSLLQGVETGAGSGLQDGEIQFGGRTRMASAVSWRRAISMPSTRIDGGIAGRCAAQSRDQGIGNKAHVHEVVLHGLRQVECHQDRPCSALKPGPSLFA
jgi:hypothetical protein